MAGRVSSAVEQLASDDLTIKLAGIYSLGSIAQEDGSHRGAIMDILNAFVTPYAEPSEVWAAENPGPPPGEIRAAFVVLARIRGRDQSPVARLPRAVLIGADLSKLNLRQAVLREASLLGADVRWSNLRLVDLRRAALDGADLSDSHVEHADPSSASLRGAKLHGLWAHGADFSNAWLMGASCRDAKLMDANFAGADLKAADFEGAILRRNQLSEEQLGQIIGVPRWADTDTGELVDP